jgi:hypothetical protein
MGALAHAFRPSGPTLGWTPCFFLPSPGDVVPLVPILVTNKATNNQNKFINKKIS